MYQKYLKGVYNKWDFIGILFLAFICSFAFVDVRLLTPEGYFKFCLPINISLVAILWLGNKFLQHLYKLKFNWDKNAVMRVFISAFISAIFTATIVYIYFELFFWRGVPESHRDVGKLIMVMFFSITVSFLVISIFEGIFLFKRSRRLLMKAEVLKRAEIRSQYEALKNQVNPHFLFNSFNTLMGLIDLDPELAKTYLMRISDVFRFVLKSNNKPLVSLTEELELVRKFFFLLEVRFNKNIILNLKITEADLEKNIAPLTLQILVENAVKHNAVSSSHPLIIEICSFENGLKIKNPIRKKTMIDYESTGLGLKNLQNRYLYLSKERLQIKDDDKEFEVYVPLLSKE